MKLKEKEFKSFHLELKDLNDKTGEVSFYYVSWKKDQEKDTFLRSAYSKTVKENLENFYHNRDHTQACGKPSKFEFDGSGGYCTSQLALKTVVGNDTYEQYKAGLIKGHSQEFQTINFDADPSGGRIIKEVRLWGVTSVTNIPANLDTPTISIKSHSDIELQMKKINDLLHNGNPSDELGEKFCTEYKRLAMFMETKSEALKAMGVVHCDGCKMIILDPMNEGKCDKCGRFVNGNHKQLPILSEDGIKNFKLF